MSRYLLLYFITLSIQSFHSQDTLIFLNREKLIAKVIELKLDTISYKRFDYIEGPLYLSAKNQIDSIVYQNGYVEKFNAIKEVQMNNSSLKFIGIRDANLYYKAYNKGIPIIIFTTTLLTPIISFIPTYLMANKQIRETDRPKSYDENVNIENQAKFEYLNDPTYSESFKKRAKQKRIKAIWGSYFLGTITSTILWNVVLVENVFNLD